MMAVSVLLGTIVGLAHPAGPSRPVSLAANRLLYRIAAPSRRQRCRAPCP